MGKSEFHAHKTVTNREQLDQFFTEWNRYLMEMQSRVMVNTHQSSTTNVNDLIEDSGIKFGSDLSPDLELSDEQKLQLDKLREEAKKAADFDCSYTFAGCH